MIRPRLARSAIFVAVTTCTLCLLWVASLGGRDPFRGQSVIPIQGWDSLKETMKGRYLECMPKERSLNIAFNMSSSEVSPCRKSLRFLNGGRAVTALASFPGSGNTWVRYLLEQVTGVLTGSIYCDRDLKAFFTGEFVTSSNVLAVKTHSAATRVFVKSATSGGRVVFSRAIVLVRDPLNALLSEAHRYYGRRQQNMHLRTVDKRKFFKSAEWNVYVQRSAYRWFSFYTYWLDPSLGIPILVLKYENLQNNLELELKRVLNFLNATWTEEDVNCVLQHRNGHFQRSKHLDLNPFTPELIQLIRSYLNQTSSLLSNYSLNY